MRALVVDDDPGKLGAVREVLLGLGLKSEDVLTADHAAGARLQLGQASIDLLVIDVLLPVRQGAKPQGENTVELLRQIVVDGMIPAPRLILGMTASIDALSNFEADFRSLVSQVLLIAPGEDVWRDTLTTSLLMLKRIEGARDANDYDICILTALRAPELAAVTKLWPVTLGDEQLLGKNLLYRAGVATVDGRERRIVCAHLPHMGPISSTHATTALLSEFRPRLLLMTGICGGFADQVEIGDVVVAENSWDWQAGKWTSEGTLLTALDPAKGSPELVAAARGADRVADQYYRSAGEGRLNRPPKVVCGPMVTGSSVVASLDIQNVFRQQHRKMAGVDMECFGMYYAVESHAGAPVRALCVKAVSDLADRAKGDDFQVYCSELSAVVALDVAATVLRTMSRA